MTRSDAWMPLYPGDYFRDTGHLSAAEHGAYLLLLMQAWTNDGQLPPEDDRLRRMARMDTDEWRRSGKLIMAFFQPNEHGFRHKRVDHELAKTERLIGQRSGAGKASAEARARKRKGDGTDNGRSNENPTGVASPLQRNARPSQPQKKDTSSLRSDAVAVAPAEPPADARTELFRDGKAILSRLTGKPPNSCGALISKWLKDLRDDCSVLMAVLRDAEERRPVEPVGWITRAVATRLPIPADDLLTADDLWGIETWTRRQRDVNEATDGETKTKAQAINGFFIRKTAEVVAEAAGLPESWRGSWDAMGAWMRDDVILADGWQRAVAAQAARMRDQGEHIRSISVFDAAVRAAAARQVA